MALQAVMAFRDRMLVAALVAIAVAAALASVGSFVRARRLSRSRRPRYRGRHR